MSVSFQKPTPPVLPHLQSRLHADVNSPLIDDAHYLPFLLFDFSARQGVHRRATEQLIAEQNAQREYPRKEREQEEREMDIYREAPSTLLIYI